jgi:hypothetical protein
MFREGRDLAGKPQICVDHLSKIQFAKWSRYGTTAQSGRSLSWYKAWEYEFRALRGGSFSAIRLLNEQIGKQLRCKVRGRSFTLVGQLLPTLNRLGRLE